MKRIRKLASLLLALAMILSMTVTAFAEEGIGSITVDNPQKDQDYTAYKIFDVVYNEAKTAYSYTIDRDSEWFEVVATAGEDGTVTSKVNGLTFQKAYGENTYIVNKGEDFSAAAFANMLKGNIEGKNGTTLSVADGQATAGSLALGYYFVSSSTGALCNLTTTEPDVTIHDKNDVPFDKTDDKVSADVGETVNYTITGKVPDTTGFETYIYTFSDTMSDGLTFQKDIAVTIGEDKLTKDYTVTYDVEKNKNEFTLTIDVMKLQQYVGQEIKVTYSAVVNENAIAKVEKNKATLTYSNDPTDTTKTTTTPPEEEEVYSSKIVIDKHKTGAENEKLAGATFCLYKEVTEGEGESAVTTKMYYKYTEATKEAPAKVEWVADKGTATSATTDENGAADFGGLANGTYYLEETEAPAGYNLLDAPQEVTIQGGAVEIDLTVTAKVANSTGSLLPSTGGIGTTIFYAAGIILMAGAVFFVVRRKKA